MKKPLIISLGEVLWNTRDANVAGAPAIFALHARSLGAESVLISAVGNDEPGRQISKRLKGRNIDIRFLQQHASLPTDTLSADQASQPAIPKNVAWDQIHWNEDMTELALGADAVCFGAAAQRSFVSRSTIMAFVQHTRKDCLRLLDLKLQTDALTPEIITSSLDVANILKVDYSDWTTLADLLGVSVDIPSGTREVLSRYSLRLIAISQGAAASTIITADEMSSRPAEPVAVQDSGGSSEAFGAALVFSLLRQASPQQAHAYASKVAAFACTQKGPAPYIPPELRYPEPH